MSPKINVSGSLEQDFLWFKITFFGVFSYYLYSVEPVEMVKILQNVSQVIPIISWYASASSTCNSWTKISNPSRIADLSTCHLCLQFHHLLHDLVNYHQLP